jgi:hypothetical protein
VRCVLVVDSGVEKKIHMLVNNERELQKCPLLFTKEFGRNRLKIMKGVGLNE